MATAMSGNYGVYGGFSFINKQLETVQQEVQDALHERTHSISALLSDWRFVTPCEQAIAKSTCFHMGVESVPKGGDD